MKTTRARVHPILAEEIDKLYQRLVCETGMETLPKGVPSKIIGDHLRQTNFVEELQLFDFRPKKQRRKEALLDLKI